MNSLLLLWQETSQMEQLTAFEEYIKD